VPALLYWSTFTIFSYFLPNSLAIIFRCKVPTFRCVMPKSYLSNHFLHVRVCHFFHLKRCPVPGFHPFVCLFPATSSCASTSFFPLHHPVPGRRNVPGCPSCMFFTAIYGIQCTATYYTRSLFNSLWQYNAEIRETVSASTRNGTYGTENSLHLGLSL
jgi:hypothetical protein